VISKDQSACTNTASGANLAACYTDAIGTALVTLNADGSAVTPGDIDSRAECQGTASAAKHGVTGTCEGWKPDSTDSTKNAAQKACLKQGSACTTKAECDAAGHTWTPKGYAWIGDQDTGANSGYIWAANTWSAGADEIKVRLSSEPLYDTTLYVQSGLFFPDGATPSATNMLADDEQIIFQDMGQYSTCYSEADVVVVVATFTRASFQVNVAAGGDQFYVGDTVEIYGTAGGCQGTSASGANGVLGFYTVTSASATAIVLTGVDTAGTTISQLGAGDPATPAECSIKRHKGSWARGITNSHAARPVHSVGLRIRLPFAAT
jgi:hypothetical protein